MKTQKSPLLFSQRVKKRLKHLLGYASVYLVVASLSACQPTQTESQLQKIKKSDVLRVGILFNPTSYYVDINGTAGFEHDLVHQFAEYLDVEIELVPSYHVSELLPKLENNQIDLLVGGLTPTEKRSERFRFSPPYMSISHKLV